MPAPREPFSAHGLRALLQQSRARNAVYEVSGMLLYHEGSFLQILEGPQDSVELISDRGLRQIQASMKLPQRGSIGRTTAAPNPDTAA